MHGNEPPWKIRTRPCPFYSQGKCFFAKNCSFLHQAKSILTITRVTGPDHYFSQLDDTDSGTAVPVNPPANPSNDTNRSFPHHSDTYAEQPDSDSNSDVNEEDSSDLDSPTIRKAILSSTANVRESGISRDSVATVKADSYGSESISLVSSSLSLSFYRKGPSFFSRSGPLQKISVATGALPASLHEDAVVDSLSQGHTPTSAISATAQEVEVPVSGDLSNTIPRFTLADSRSSSLMANRLAKLRGPAPSSPTIVRNPSTPFSAGAFYEYYQQDEVPPSLDSSLIQNTKVDKEPASPEHVPSSPHIASRTPSWLKPLRLASILTPPIESRTSISPSDPEQENNTSVTQSVVSSSSSTCVSSGSSYQLSVARESLTELYPRSSTSSSHIPTDTPHSIVLSDHDGYVSPLTLSRSGSLYIDPSNFPPPPVSSPDTSAHDLSSPASVSLAELTGRSPKPRPIPRITSSANPNALPLKRATTPAEQLRSALERRAKRMKESSVLLASIDLSQIGVKDEASASSAQSLVLDSTVATSLSHSRDVSSASDFELSRSWNKPPQVDLLPRPESLPNTSASGTLLHVAQSSPPRNSLDPRPKPYGRSTLPLANAGVLSHAPSPDPSPRPDLLFAIASDQPAEVERLLSTGKASANETTGSGTGVLEFTVTNEGLKNKTEIVKTLLKYGADPDSLKHDTLGSDDEQARGVEQPPDLTKKVKEGMNPALKYYLNRPQSLDIDSKPALEALQQSSFAPLAKARFDIIGQDRALDELYRVLGIHSQRKTKNALVILLCGASGHGKSLLAQKVGSLLDVPTHTINMTALRSQHDLWQCLSTGMEDASPHLDLSEFLVENQGKRCVVVLDEIEKVDDSKSLNPLLLPWDIGRCSLEQKKHTDALQVIWIATSNLGQKIISEHVEQWGHPDKPPTRSEYTQLATAIRRRIAEVLGASLLSRVTTILPFLPFTEIEKIAIGTEAALSYQEFSSTPLSSAEIEDVVRRAVKDVNLVEDEGARSLYRVVETNMIRA